MSLQKYAAKRDFTVTPEPASAGVRREGARLQFVVQLHAARRRHFDLRLELDGVLKSWAVPNGPSDNPDDKRLAVAVEDHPLSYAGFEGVIPEGQYGAGAVIVWDRGSWTPSGDPRAGLRKGRLSFELRGERLRGAWSLIRTGGKEGTNWLWIKKRDADAVVDQAPVGERHATSVVSGRTLEQVRQGVAAVGASRASSAGAKKSAAAANEGSSPPRFIPPLLATPSAEPPADDRWIHEIKLDGYRMQLRIDRGQATWRSRNGHDWTARLPELTAAAAGLPVDAAIIDGELVALDEQGRSDFVRLQQHLRRGRTDKLTFYAFDLLWDESGSVMKDDLVARKRRLAEIVPSDGRIRFLDHVVGRGDEFFELCRQQGLEGSIAKRGDRPYRSGRGRDWLKCKAWERALFVVGGWDRSPDAIGQLGALLVGYFTPAGDFVYAGRIGHGTDEAGARQLHDRLAAAEQKAFPFSSRLSKKEAAGARWCEPRVVVAVRFAGATHGGRIRQGIAERLRDDVAAADVVRAGILEERSEDPASSTTSKRAEPACNAATGNAAPVEPLELADQEELRELRLTHPDRVLYPEVGLTKLDLVRYYVQVARWMLPHVLERPLSLVRCPHGAEGKCFFQKRAMVGMPPGLRELSEEAEPESSGSGAGDSGHIALVAERLLGVLAAVQINALELHIWGCRRDRVDRPDRLVFDLDPDPTVPWREVVAVAHETAERLRRVGLESFVKVSGGKGLHVTVPITRRTPWETAFEFTQQFVQQWAAEQPRRIVATMSKSARRDKIFIDFHRNRRGATTVAPYSTRNHRRATVAAPVGWDELDDLAGADVWTVQNLPERLARLAADPWAKIDQVRQSITAAALRQVRSRGR